jgi:hypothetical protein
MAMEYWYVYYKLPESARAETIDRVHRMQGALAAEVGGMRLVERTDSGETLTFMEVYEGIDTPSRFAAALEEAVLRSGLPGELRAARRTERFRDI